MTPIRPLLAALPLVALLAACSASAPPSVAPSPMTPAAGADAPVPAAAPSARERAQAAAQDFSGSLRGQLKARLGEGGPVAAVEFCKVEAPKIAAAAQARHGVTLGRVPVAGRMRNPANAPGDWQAKVLADFEARARAGEAADTLAFAQSEGLPEGVALRMAKGIAVEPGCLTCHGKAIAEPVRAALAKQYPGDTATGFEVGDLRGLLWVEVPAAPAP